MHKSVVVFLCAVTLIGLTGGCQPRTVVTTVEVAVTSQANVVQVTATPAPTDTPSPPTATPAPANVTVCASDCDFSTLQAAIDDAGTIAGSTINVVDAVHTEAGVVVNKDVIIQGQGAGSTTVQAHETAGEAADRVFVVAEGTTVVIRDVTIRHGKRSDRQAGSSFGGDKGGGGGILNYGTLALENCVVRDNSARHGGGVLNRGTLRAVDCSFLNNVARGSAVPGQSCGAGGGVKHNGPRMELVNCTFSGNEADTNGGGIHVACAATAVLTNCTISGNTAEGGGAITVKGQLALVHSTIAGNTAATASDGGGVYVRGVLSYTNTIIANNRPGGDCTAGRHLGGSQPGGTIGVNANNLVGDGGCDSTYSGDPRLDVLADNGGRTQTHALLPGSPAIDAVPAGECVVRADQRGQARPQGAGCDIGAFELGGE
jgi:parallel beta-helix repeat protein